MASSSVLDILRQSPKFSERLASLSDGELYALLYDWETAARPNQKLPAGDWATWLILAGRGYGKTRVGAETVRHWIKRGFNRVNFIAPTADDLRDVMVEGESGILAVCPQGERPLYRVSKRRLEWPNGALSLLFTAQEPDRIRGKQHEKLWGDEPACVVPETLVETEHGPRMIDTIQAGERVWTRAGLRRVTAAWMSSPDAEVLELELINGRRLVGTRNHPIFVQGKGFIHLSSVRCGDTILPWEQSKALCGAAGAGGLMADIYAIDAANFSIARSTDSFMGRSRRTTSFITSTSAKQTTIRRILRRLPKVSICGNIRRIAHLERGSSNHSASAPFGKRKNHTSAPASIARLAFLRPEREQNSVRRDAGPRREGCFSPSNIGSIKSRDPRKSVQRNRQSSAGFAGRHSGPLIRAQCAAPSSAAPNTVKKVCALVVRRAVFNLSVEDKEEYFANGILVHNSWRYDTDAWDQAQFGLRLGANPQAILTTTPRATKFVRGMIADPTTIVTRGTTYENRGNLAPGFYTKIINKYENTRLGRQELLAEILDDNPDALFHLKDIEGARVRKEPPLLRIVVAMDPATTSNENSDEWGIVAAGHDGRDPAHFYILEDESGVYTPDEAAKVAVRLYHRLGADRLVGEANNGGDMIEALVRHVDTNVAYRKVTASRGKRVRAEPVSALYEQHRVHHVGMLAKLEDQATQWNPKTDKDSPDRMDAMVWAVTELGGGMDGWAGFVKDEGKSSAEAPKEPRINVAGGNHDRCLCGSIAWMDGRCFKCGLSRPEI